MNFVTVHTNGINELLLNVESISFVQAVNGGTTTRIALSRGDDLFVSDTYESIMQALHDVNGVQFVLCE